MPAAHVTVTVRVSDGRGGTAEATCTVRMVCPARPKPEAVTCTSGGFPRNLARLNNVDKACLDDVASRCARIRAAAWSSSAMPTRASGTPTSSPASAPKR